MKRDITIKKRHEAIKELIQSHAVSDQEGLVQLLDTEYGIKVNQAIVSRDLKQLNITKHLVKGKFLYELSTLDTTKEMLRLAVVSVEHNESLVVVNTIAGLADFVGDYLDNQPDLAIIGTIAGENIVFIAPKSIKDIKNLYAAVCAVLYIKLSN